MVPSRSRKRGRTSWSTHVELQFLKFALQPRQGACISGGRSARLRRRSHGNVADVIDRRKGGGGRLERLAEAIEVSFAPLIERVKPAVVSIKVMIPNVNNDGEDLSGQFGNLPPDIQRFFKQFGGSDSGEQRGAAQQSWARVPGSSSPPTAISSPTIT